MSSSENPKKTQSLYPEVILTNPESSPYSSNSNPTSNLYPTIDMNDLAENLFPDEEEESSSQNDVVLGNQNQNQPTSFESSEEVVIEIPGAIVHLIDKEQSIELASGVFSIVQLKQGGNVVAALARVGDEIQWPLAKDESAVKLDESHYFFSLRVPNESGEIGSDGILNYGLTIANKGQEDLLRELDLVLEGFSDFRIEETSVEGPGAMVEAGWWKSVSRGVSKEEMETKKDEVEKSAAVYWTTLAPNVEDYSGSLARFIAAGSGQVVRGILWCGDLTVDRLNWGHDFLAKRVGRTTGSNVSPGTLRRMKRAKQMTKMSEKVATGILSGVVKVSGFFTSSVANSKVGQKFFSLLPGEIILASLDGFNKVFDAVEVAGRNVMSTTNVVTTGLVTHRYGEQAAEATHDGLDAAGHAIGTAWAVFKIRKALNPKSVFKPTTLAKAAAAEASAAKLKSKSKSK